MDLHHGNHVSPIRTAFKSSLEITSSYLSASLLLLI
jgi:hypothetical protein